MGVHSWELEIEVIVQFSFTFVEIYHHLSEARFINTA